MLSEDFDKKMREAADRHHPQYDVRAWREMKKLLEEHMPVEEDRKRRGLFFLLFLLLLGGGAAVYFFGFTGSRKDQITENVRPVAPADQNTAVVQKAEADQGESNDQTAQPIAEKDPSPAATPVTVLPEKASTSKEPVMKTDYPAVSSGSINATTRTRKEKQDQVPAVRQQAKNLVKKEVTGKINENDIIPAEKKKTNSGDKNQSIVTTEGNKNPKQDPVSQPSVTTVAAPAPVPAAAGKDNAAKKDDQTVAANDPAAGNTTTKTPAAPPVTVKTETRSNPTKQVSKKKSNFFITATAAPDVSFTSGDELGRLKHTGGIGLGYTYRGRLSLRTGFFSGRKIYTASPDNYKRTAWFNQYYPNLQKVEADCKVQEIPILLSYHFGQQGNHQWFASAGVSTLIMKEETYDYYYKYTAWGQVVNRSHTTYNQNKHPFSIMTLSAGYQHQLGKRFSLIAEPYLKLPLSGVGNGKVKLNSMGVMFSVTASPFGK